MPIITVNLLTGRDQAKKSALIRELADAAVRALDVPLAWKLETAPGVAHSDRGMMPFALKVLGSFEYPTEGFRSKSWEEFAHPGAPVMDFVFTVCDNAAGESCPVWPGQPMTAHWGIEDPAAVEGPDIEKEKAFVSAFRYMRNRISVFTALPVASLDKSALGTKLREIGRSEGATSPRPDVA